MNTYTKNKPYAGGAGAARPEGDTYGARPNTVRAATRTEVRRNRAMGLGLMMVVLMLTAAITFTALALNQGTDGEGGEVVGPLAFAVPIQGEFEVTKYYSDDVLFWNATANRWEGTYSYGCKAEKGTPVVATYAGTIESVVNNSMYGTMVTIKHRDGLKTVYSGLQAAPNVSVSTGDYVEKGQRIGLVGDTLAVEAHNGPYITVDVYLNDEMVNPATYIPFGEK
jgi:murein DD-endopeptidase MepM/ murein hydrolase activator NlpD